MHQKLADRRSDDSSRNQRRRLDDALDDLGRLIQSERSKLAQLARREGLGAEDAIDCVQDGCCTFLRLAQTGQVPATPSELPAFLATIVKNAARNRRRLHHVARPHEALDAIDPSGDDASTEQLLARAEDHVRLRACVDRLCDTQKAVVTWRLLDEQPGEDVAEALGISRGYVDVLLHRAKIQLRACLTDDEMRA
ncbi:MAG: sigma-70 family RNA polymerase sigma factor [Myxococcales bacterium]|nr:sigma-70 family RNA polymerase sigma factor [Myxococcales bacterium]